MSSTPNIGFVSLGCPKNLVDSERILTELRSNGYNIIPSYENADLVIVNTCGFIDSAVQESLEAIGEALEENGKVIVTSRFLRTDRRTNRCAAGYPVGRDRCGPERRLWQAWRGGRY